MARKPRIHYPGAVYHVILRGNAGQPIFLDDRDRTRLYLLIQEGVERFGCRIHAFCLMTNHLHLALQVGEKPLSRIMQNICFRYTRWVNWRYGKTGHLFQGRYKAILLDADSYLLELVRYIHLNPVRSHMVALPEEHPWSSHRAYLEKETIPWLTTEWVLSVFSTNKKVALKKYHEFLSNADDDSAKPALSHGNIEGRILGDDLFADEAMRMSGEPVIPKVTINEVLILVAREYMLDMKDLTSAGRERTAAEARAMTALLVRENTKLTLSDLAKHLGRDLSTMSYGAKRLVERARRDKSLSERIERLATELNSTSQA